MVRITIHEETILERSLGKLIAYSPEEMIELAAIKETASNMHQELLNLSKNGSVGEFKKTLNLGAQKVKIVAKTKSQLSLFEVLAESLGIR